MNTGYRRAYQEAASALEQVLQAGDGTRLAEELWAVATTVDANPVLRRNLGDPSREGQDKAALAERLLSGKIHDEALAVVRAVVAQRWPEPADLVSALEQLAVEANLAHAQGLGRLGQVEDELFRFGRIVEATPDLQAALSNRRADAGSKATLVDRLLSVKTAPETVRLAKMAVASTRGRRFDHALKAYLEQAAARQDQVTATVVSAVPLTPEQHDRLARTLSAQYGRQVHTNVVIDEDVVGGIRVEIGDEVIDGTVRHRLADARRRMTS
ncbi:F0F1 ATP synthase subunit delta [Ornithinimicrobium humiphilum]|uniref:ATP synthase subunit delta n=1 Tax=Ornithinimicrobium humiphilum TaxID=125288 RepID=A0A543KLN5_9MICO|nr:F0F1 ATP synthase subunit delta [Ornithinimicrobium humiphilum]TQM95970.1 ATP synthase F1 subcomplex delta subunit [Ornithinimicrobium humiphilum]